MSGGPGVVLAVNPSSGRGRGARAGRVAEQRLRAAGLRVDVLVGADAREAAAGLVTAARAADAVVVVGGDGMVHLGLQAVAGTPVPLGIVPAGTGNDIARGLGLPVGDWAAAADVAAGAVRAGRARELDGVRCAVDGGPDCWFAGVLGAGFDAVVNERANSWSWPRGSSRYVLALLRELPVFVPRDYTLVLDGEVWKTPAMLVTVANSPSYGGGMRVCPDALMDDGLLDLMVVEPISRPELLRIFPRVFAGTHVRHPRVHVRRARRIEVAADGIVGYADGERLGPLPISCEAVPGAFRALATVGE